MTRSEFIADNPIEAVLASRGFLLQGNGSERKCKCPFHEDGTPSFSVNVDKQAWKCMAGCGGGGVIDLLAKFEGITPVQLIQREGITKDGGAPNTPAQRKSPAPAKAAPKTPPPVSAPKAVEPEDELDWKVAKTYDYQNQFGEMVFQVVRLQADNPKKASGYSKTFRQRRRDDRGGWVYNMEGVERMLYRLPEVLKGKEVWLVEGEKDADNLVRLGFNATCNVGGAGKWLDGYTVTLKGKTVILCGDTDQPGVDHMDMVFDSINGSVKKLKKIRLPSAVKDVSDFIATFPDDAAASQALRDLMLDAVPFLRGVSVPIHSIAELEAKYINFVRRMSTSAFQFSSWLPSLRTLRPVTPGQLVLFIGKTGIGKTAILSNLSDRVRPMPTLFFELELPDEDMFERYMAMKMMLSCRTIEENYKGGDQIGEEQIDETFGHVFISSQSKVTVDQIAKTITQSSLRIGERPRVVLIDYAGLVQGHGKGRYEKQSSVAEDLKVLAKETNTIMIVSAQVARKKGDDDVPEVGLNDARDSGSWEQSAQLVFGAWRDPNDASLMTLKVLKATKGGAGTEVKCNYDLNTLRITERALPSQLPATSEMSLAEWQQRRQPQPEPQTEMNLNPVIDVETLQPPPADITQPPDERE